MNSQYQILLFYKYVLIENPEETRDWFVALSQKYHLTGRSIVAREGINFTCEGKVEDTENFIKEMETDPRFLHIHFKRSIGTGNAFRKLSIKVRTETVSGHLGACDIDPNQLTGIHLAPETLHEWIHSGKKFHIIDMRNIYEHQVGKFAGSICPPLENFRDLPKIIKGISHLKYETVVTVCTGGIRCEKASGYLLSQGFTDVYQLYGGIVSYMEKYPNEDFEGKLYVFDGRVVMGFYTDDPKHKVIGRCESCGSATEHFVNCDHAWCGKHFLLCETCEKEKRARGAVTCIGNCRMRHPNKMKSPWMRTLGKLWIALRDRV